MSLTGLGLGHPDIGFFSSRFLTPKKCRTFYAEPPQNPPPPISPRVQALQGACLGVAEFGRLLRENHVILDYASPGALQSFRKGHLPSDPEESVMRSHGQAWPTSSCNLEPSA